jgi:chromosome segregation ATPase
MKVTELLNELGKIRSEANQLYSSYKELKDQENRLRADLVGVLDDLGLKQAKNEDYIASISLVPKVVIKDELSAMEWIYKNLPEQQEQYIGIKRTEFGLMAKVMLKDIGELIPGTDVETTESLIIKANYKKGGQLNVAN